MSSKVERARTAGHTDEEILDFLIKKNPDLAEKSKLAAEKGHSVSDIVNYLGSRQENKPKSDQKLGAADYAKDVAVMGAKGLAQGSAAYGDILDLIGLNPKTITPGSASYR